MVPHCVYFERVNSTTQNIKYTKMSTIECNTKMFQSISVVRVRKLIYAVKVMFLHLTFLAVLYILSVQCTVTVLSIFFFLFTFSLILLEFIETHHDHIHSQSFSFNFIFEP